MQHLKSWEELREAYHSSSLPLKGVRLPQPETQKAQTLLYLYQNLGRTVTKSEAEQAICQRMNIPTKDIQSLRHLSKQDGFNILQGGASFEGYTLKRGEYMLVDLESTNPYWKASRRDESDLDFDSLKKKFKHRCATCGEKEASAHRLTGELVKLEKGHMDPTMAMTDDNIVPQCGYCNKMYKNNFVFGATGFVKKPTVNGVMNLMTKEEKKQLFMLLGATFSSERRYL